VKKHLIQGAGAEMPMASGFQAQERPQAQHDHHHHARDTARSRAEHLLWAMTSSREAQKLENHCSPLPIGGLLGHGIPVPFMP
jgi:hypothetical protein